VAYSNADALLTIAEELTGWVIVDLARGGRSIARGRGRGSGRRELIFTMEMTGACDELFDFTGYRGKCPGTGGGEKEPAIGNCLIG
jgi:hypothetical protein